MPIGWTYNDRYYLGGAILMPLERPLHFYLEAIIRVDEVGTDQAEE